jgi:riboflavin kinase/FMN adenylyltransferase
VRPTFGPHETAPQIRIETHLLDEKRDLYGDQLQLRFVTSLRDEQKFASIEALRAQIAADIVNARQVLDP